MLKIHALQTPYLDSWSYILEEGGQAVVIDPCTLPESELLLKELTVSIAILTHAHWDHVMGVPDMQKSGVPVLCCAKCAENLKDPKKNGSRYARDFCSLQDTLRCAAAVEAFSLSADRTFEQETSLGWQGHTLTLTETPGHTNGGICIDVDGEFLFTGDTLFENEATNTRYLTGSRRDFQNITLPFLRSLGERKVYPGHFGCFSLAQRLRKLDGRDSP